MVRDALMRALGGTYQILAAQEIPNQESAEYLRALLPGGNAMWNASFFDSTDTMDNGYWYRAGITLRANFPLYVLANTDSAGRYLPDVSRAVHPPQVAQFEIDDFDFTLITVHLTFAEGRTAESEREMRSVLDYLDWYFQQPAHEPDVVICGDFNIPSRLSGQTGQGGITLDSILESDGRFRDGNRRFVVTVHEPTSRASSARGGSPSNNYDHCVLSIDTLEEFIQARRIETNVLTDHSDDPEQRLTSDHFPIVSFFRTRGSGS